MDLLNSRCRSDWRGRAESGKKEIAFVLGTANNDQEVESAAATLMVVNSGHCYRASNHLE